MYQKANRGSSRYSHVSLIKQITGKNFDDFPEIQPTRPCGTGGRLVDMIEKAELGVDQYLKSGPFESGPGRLDPKISVSWADLGQ